jgi:uncharacterized protein DUF4266
MNTRRHWLIAALLLVTVGTSGCATVRPWDRDLLARKSMRFVPLPHEMAADDHIYFSKEGSMGGASAEGGGCGCN